MAKRNKIYFVYDLIRDLNINWESRNRIKGIMIPFAGNELSEHLLFDGCLCATRTYNNMVVLHDIDDWIVQRQFNNKLNCVNFYLRLPKVLTWDYIWTYFEH